MASQSREARLVLVVDDHEPMRALCRISLEEAGFRVSEAIDGEEAIRQIAAEPPDVILLDVMMPRVSGWQVAAALLEQPATDNIPIVFITARSGRADRARALALGAWDYLTKPFDPAVLPDVIARLLDEVARGERGGARADALADLRAQRVLED
jgi:CheY-like chemotaxis protein